MYSHALVLIASLLFLTTPSFSQSPNISIQGFVWDDANGDGEYIEEESLLSDWTVYIDTNRNQAFDEGEPSQNTDATGTYFFTNLAAGSYTVRLTPTHAWGIIHPLEEAHTFTLSEGGLQDFVDFGVTRLAPTSIGDFAWLDADENGIQDSNETGLGNVSLYLVHARSDERIDSTITNNEGAYSLETQISGTYYIAALPPDSFEPTVYNEGEKTTDSNLDPSLPYTRGLLTGWRTPSFQIFSGTSYSDYDIGLRSTSLATGSIGDIIWHDDNQNGVQDTGEPGISGVSVGLREAGSDGVLDTSDDNTTFLPTTTASDGSYNFGALLPGLYRVEVDAITLPAHHVPTFDPDGTLDHQTEVTLSTTNSNHALADFGFIEGATIGDFTWRDYNGNGIQDSGEPGLRDVGITLHATDGTTLASVTSDALGLYSFTTAPGDYYLAYTPPASSYLLSQAHQTSDHIDSDPDPTTLQTPIFTVAAGTPMPDWDAGFFERAEIGNLVWSDENGDGLQSSGEGGISGVSVSLFDHNGLLVASTTTDVNGRYLFSGVTPNQYVIEFQAPPNYSFSPKDVGGDDTNDSDADRNSGRTDVFVVASGMPSYTRDAGLYPTATVAFTPNTSATPNESSFGHILALALRMPGGTTLNHTVVAEITDLGTGTASSGLDYSPVGTLTALFPAGSQDGDVQTVTLSVLNDLLFEGDETVELTVNVMGPADPVSPATHTLTITDDDAPTILVTPTSGLVTDESGRTASFAISLNGAPSADVTANFSSSNTQEGTLSTNQVVFTSSNWHIPQRITITGSDDAIADGDQAYTITIDPATSADPNFNGIDPSDVSVTNLDDDTPGIAVNPSGLPLTTDESGSSETVSVALVTQPAHDVTITIMSTDGSEATVSPSGLIYTPTNWQTAQSFDVTGQNDSIGDGDQAYQIQFSVSSLDASYASLGPTPLNGINADDEYIVSGRVWDDVNTNGIQDRGETGIPNIQVELRESSTNTFATATTDTDGQYTLDGMLGSSSAELVYVFLDLPDAYAISNRNQGSDPTLDSDFNNISDRTPRFFIQNGADTTHVDAGLYDASFCGSYTIGLNGDYSSLERALHFLHTYGVSCPTVFKIKQGSYTESRPLSLSGISGISATNTVTFEAEDLHNKPDIQYDNADPLFTIEDPHIIFSGLRIETTYEAIFSVLADTVSILQCDLIGQRLDGSEGNHLTKIGSATSFVSGLGYEGILLESNSFSQARWAVKTYPGSNTIIRRNTFSDLLIGIEVDGLDIEMSSNVFANVLHGITTGTGSDSFEISDNTFTNAYTAINAQYCDRCLIDSNFIYDASAKGISLGGRTGAVSSTRIINNMIALADSGIVIHAHTQHVDIFHNSVRSSDVALHLGGTNQDIRVINNILLNSGTDHTQTLAAYEVTDPSVLATSDYNVFYSYNSVYPILFNGTRYRSISAFSRTTGHGGHSIIKAPSFIAPDLHLTGSSRGDTDLAGTNLLLLDDFDGDTRLSTCPYRGADEASQPLCNTAYLRVLNGISDPSLSSVQARINGELFSEQVVFRQTTPWTSLEPGTYTFSLHSTGSNKAESILLEKTLTLEVDQRYLVTATGVRKEGSFVPNPDNKNTDIDVQVLGWSFSPSPEMPDAWATLTHAVTDAGPLSIALLGTHHTLRYGESAQLPLLFPEDHSELNIELAWDSLAFRFALSEEQLRRWQGETIPLLLSGFRSPSNNADGELLNLHALVQPDSTVNLTPIGYVSGSVWNDLDGNGKHDWAEPAFTQGSLHILHADTVAQTIVPNKKGFFEAWLPHAMYELSVPELQDWRRSDTLVAQSLLLELTPQKPQAPKLHLGMHERAQSFVVTSTRDASDETPGDGICGDASSVCTLRAAIQEANASPGRNHISFAFPNNITSLVIQPLAPLPEITESIVLDGTRSVVLDGTLAGPSTNGLALNHGPSILTNLSIQGFDGVGIVLDGIQPSRVLRTHLTSNKKGGLSIQSGSNHYLSENTFFQNESFAIQTTEALPFSAPLLESWDSSTQSLDGHVKGQPEQLVRLELYTSTTCAATGISNGERFLGSWEGMTDTTGRWVFSINTSLVAPKGLTAIAQDSQGRTSVFSNCLAPTATTTTHPAQAHDFPTTYGLTPSYPNPFNPTTTLPFAIPEPSTITIRIFDMTGRQVDTHTQHYAAGHHSIVWNASHWASGMYLVQFSAESDIDASSNFQDVQKWVLLK